MTRPDPRSTFREVLAASVARHPGADEAVTLVLAALLAEVPVLLLGDAATGATIAGTVLTVLGVQEVAHRVPGDPALPAGRCWIVEELFAHEPQDPRAALAAVSTTSTSPSTPSETWQLGRYSLRVPVESVESPDAQGLILAAASRTGTLPMAVGRGVTTLRAGRKVVRDLAAQLGGARSESTADRAPDRRGQGSPDEAGRDTPVASASLRAGARLLTALRDIGLSVPPAAIPALLTVTIARAWLRGRTPASLLPADFDVFCYAADAPDAVRAALEQARSVRLSEAAA